MKNKIITVVLLVVLVAGLAWFLNGKDKSSEESQQTANQKTGQTSPENLSKTENQTAEDLVWYEVPEMNIKFKVDKKISEVIGYREQYIEEGKTGGYELYTKNYPKYPQISKQQESNKQDSFSSIIAYNDYANDPNMKWVTSCEGDSCCPADPAIRKLLIKTNKTIVCYYVNSFSKEYNKTEGIYNGFDAPTKKLFDGYLTTVTVEEIEAEK